MSPKRCNQCGDKILGNFRISGERFQRTHTDTTIQHRKYDASGIMLRTCMQGGTTHDGEQELINSLRYGLLARERIISKEDIKSYLLHKLGKYVESVEVGNGVAISPDSKKD